MNKVVFRFLFFITLVNMPSLCSAQNFSYSLSKDSSAYTALNSPTVLSSNESWVNKSFKIHFPFQLNFCGIPTDSLKIETNGFLVLNTSKRLAITSFNDFTAKKDTNQNFVSSIDYIIEGTTGSRIVKIEFNNIAQNTLCNSDFLSYQVWLYEGGNIIEFHVGNNAVTNNASGQHPILLGLINQNMDTDSSGFLLTGSPSSPSGQIISNSDDLQYLYTVPYSGTIYTLTPTF